MGRVPPEIEPALRRPAAPQKFRVGWWSMPLLRAVLSERHAQLRPMARVQNCNGGGRSIALWKRTQVALMLREEDAFRVALGEHRQSHQ